MAWTVAHSNITNFSILGQQLFALKTGLKAAGWTVVASGDGNALSASGSDVITGDGSGANGYNNTRAWVCLQQPTGGTSPYSGSRQIVLQNGDDLSTQARFVYSPGGTAALGSIDADTCPTFSDQLMICGGGTPASPTWEVVNTYTASPGTGHLLVGGAAENFSWVWTSSLGANTIRNFWFMDACRRANATDNDPFIFMSMNSSAPGTAIGVAVSEGEANGRPKGQFPAGFLGVGLYDTIPENNSHQQLSGNAFEANKDILVTPSWVRTKTVGGAGGYKGRSTLFRINNNTSRNTNDKYTVTVTGDRLEIGATNSNKIALCFWDNTSL